MENREEDVERMARQGDYAEAVLFEQRADIAVGGLVKLHDDIAGQSQPRNLVDAVRRERLATVRAREHQAEPRVAGSRRADNGKPHEPATVSR
jgi:hypothetical protein